LGKKDGINPKVFMGFINRVAQGARIDLGRIDLMQNFSFFEVPEKQTKTVLNVLNGTDFDGRKVNVEVTDQPEGQRGSEKKRGGGNRFHAESFHTEKKPKKGSGVIRGGSAKPKPSREERGYTSARGPKGAAEWAKFFEGQVESQPFYENFKKKKSKK
jgi:ATP-dependent RNA helicase DeaD